MKKETAGIPLLPYASFTGYGIIKCCDWIGARAIYIFYTRCPARQEQHYIFSFALGIVAEILLHLVTILKKVDRLQKIAAESPTRRGMPK